MHRIDTSTAQRDKFGQGKNGFTRGNPQTGTPATQLDYLYCDAIQEEIARAIESAGFTLDKSKHDQLATAIKEFVKKGSVKFNSSTDSTSETEAATPLAVKKANDQAVIANANAISANSNANNAHNKISNMADKFQFDESESRVNSPNKKIHLLVRNDGVIGSYNIEQKKIVWAFGGDGVLGEGKILADNVLYLYDFVRNMFSTGWNDYGGFFKIPGGLLVQFGRTNYVESTGAGGTVQPFFTAFPNGCLSIVCGDLDGGANTVSAIAISKTHFKCWGKNVGRYANTALYYIAVGV